MNCPNSVHPTVDLSIFNTQHPSSDYNESGILMGHKVTPSSVNETHTTEFLRQEKQVGNSSLFCRSCKRAGAKIGYFVVLALELVTKIMVV